MYFGLPVMPIMKNFYAWTPSYGTAIPEWVDDYFPNTSPDNFIVYTKNPMRKFLMNKDDVIVRCTLGSVVFFTIINKEWFQNWWEIGKGVGTSGAHNFDVNKELSYIIFEK